MLGFRLEELDALAEKLKQECSERAPVVDSLEGRVAELEGTSASLSRAQVEKAASDLTQERQVCSG